MNTAVPSSWRGAPDNSIDLPRRSKVIALYAPAVRTFRSTNFCIVGMSPCRGGDLPLGPALPALRARRGSPQFMRQLAYLHRYHPLIKVRRSSLNQRVFAAKQRRTHLLGCLRPKTRSVKGIGARGRARTYDPLSGARSLLCYGFGMPQRRARHHPGASAPRARARAQDLRNGAFGHLCTPDRYGISHCHNEIRLADGTVILVQEDHNMQYSPCLAPSEPLLVEPATTG